jgi:Family of unknown function (DUF6665)
MRVAKDRGQTTEDAKRMRERAKFLSVVRRPSFIVGHLEVEIAKEKAASLGRLGRRLEAALAALSGFDAGPAHTRGSGQREALVAHAGMALWHFIVQREACGLKDSTRVMQDYRVPSEVRARMGVFPHRRTEDKRRATQDS